MDLILQYVLITIVTAVLVLLGTIFFLPRLLIPIGVRLAILFSQFKNKYVKLDKNVFCHYLERGNVKSSERSILFVHGFSGSAVDFVKVPKYFDKSTHLVAVDLWNHGWSSYKLEEITMKDMVQFLKMFVERSDLHRRTFHLIGFSLGGLVSAAYAHDYREDLATLTLLAAPLSVRDVSLEKNNGCLQIKTNEDMRNILDLFGNGKIKIPFEFIVTALRHHKNYISLYQAQVFMGINKKYELTADILKGLAALPMSLILGDSDQVVPSADATFIKTHVPDIKVHLIKDCGHTMLITHLAQTIESIQKFLG